MIRNFINNLGFVKKRKAKEELIRLNTIKRVNKIKIEIKLLDDRATKIASDDYKNECESEKKHNSTCSMCQSKNVNNRIKRQQGSINGSMSGSGYNTLLFGKSSMSGSISGTLDTNGVNKCNDCGNEWKKYVINVTYASEMIITNIHTLIYKLDSYHKAINCTFEPLDINEKFNSLEEKQKTMINDLSNDWQIKQFNYLWGGISFDTLNELVNIKMNEYNKERYYRFYNEDFLKIYGFIKFDLI